MRDVRGGQGERLTFRQGLDVLYKNFRSEFESIVKFVPEFGRWDDILKYTDSEAVQLMVKMQLATDMNSERPSLLGKWMPSVNTSSKETVSLARKWAKILGVSEKEYRKSLAALRKKINVVECQMSAGDWEQINFSSVPSRASMIYRDAFNEHGGDRYQKFLDKALTGEVKINSAALYPYELVGKYLVGYNAWSNYGGSDLDKTVEAQWAQLPNYADTQENALVVCDTSGSMFQGKPMAIEVAISLAIYIAERNKGKFANKFITFSDSPSLQDLQGKTLYEKVVNLAEAEWGMSTNLESVFELVLDTATRHKMPESEMPTKIFIVSDMEFNSCVKGTNYNGIKRRYEKAGYKLPEIVFWNVMSRNDQVPVTKDEKGTFLVSGCSPSIFKNAVNCKATTAQDLMLEVLNGERYSKIVF